MNMTLPKYTKTVEVVAFKISQVVVDADNLWRVYAEEPEGRFLFVHANWVARLDPQPGQYLVLPQRAGQPYCVDAQDFELHYVRRYEPEQEQDHDRQDLGAPGRVADEAEPSTAG